MQVDIEALKRKWAPEIEQARREGAAEGDARMALRVTAVALCAELDEAVRANDSSRALPVMALLEETNRAIDAMNVAGIASVLSGLELIAKKPGENNNG